MASGWDVVWATGANACARVTQAGIAAVPAGITSGEWRDIRTTRLAGRETPPVEMGDHVFPLFGAIAAPPMLADLLELTAEWQPDLVIHDAAEFAGAIVAASQGVPSVTHGYGALTPAHRVARAGEEAAPLWQAVGLGARPYGGSYEWLYLDIYPASLQPTETAHVPRRQALRPVAFETGDDAESDGWNWADRGGGRPLVYLTFGTVYNQPDRIRVVLEAIASLDVSLLVTIGRDGDPALLGSQPDNVWIERYVPQARVFRHCDVVVSHGGSGTVLGAVSEGLPQLCLPQAADQFLNASACERSGIGLSLAPNQASGPAIADAVQRLLSEPGFQAQAKTLAQEVAEMPPPEEAVRILDELAK